MNHPQRGEIWLVGFPFTDLTSTKVRPALVIATHGPDVIVLGLFSRVPAGPLKTTWLLIPDNDPAFPQAGLKKTSVLRAEKIAVIHESVFHSRLGRLSDHWMPQVDQALKHALQLS